VLLKNRRRERDFNVLLVIDGVWIIASIYWALVLLDPKIEMRISWPVPEGKTVLPSIVFSLKVIRNAPRRIKGKLQGEFSKVHKAGGSLMCGIDVEVFALLELHGLCRHPPGVASKKLHGRNPIVLPVFPDWGIAGEWLLHHGMCITYWQTIPDWKTQARKTKP